MLAATMVPWIEQGDDPKWIGNLVEVTDSDFIKIDE
jgi:hypothetical protein